MGNSDNHICYNCQSTSSKIIHNGVRDNDSLDVLQCENCGLVFLSDDSQISNLFYEEGGMFRKSDFESWKQNTLPDDRRRFITLKKLIEGKILTDFGCGNANFLNLAKTSCKKVYGIELQKYFCEYFKDCGLSVFESLDKLPEKQHGKTMFHVLEHLKNPVNMLKEISQYLNDDGKIIIEVPNANDALLSLFKCKSFADFTYWSCHLFLFNKKTLVQIVEKAGLKVEKASYIQRYTFMIHLQWLIKYKPAGHKIWRKYDLKLLNLLYSIFLKLIGMTDTIEIVVSKKSL